VSETEPELNAVHTAGLGFLRASRVEASRPTQPCTYTTSALLIMVALCNMADHYIFILFLPLSSFFSFPRLISAVGDWMSTILPHMVWP